MKQMINYVPLLFCMPLAAFAVEFQSPSGNILCNGDEFEMSSVSCLIVEVENKKPPIPKPKDCQFDWGQDFSLDHKGKAYMNCYSDFPYNQDAKVLPYGQSINGKGWTCTSQKTGMRCVNKDGKGFLLSRKKQILF